MNDVPKKEILSLLESPELREYLMAPPEKLNCTQYAEIICGAPVSLYRKRELLLRLKAEASEEEKNNVAELLYALDTARKPLESAELPGIQFIVELLGYNEKERSVDTLDGPFAVRSLTEAQQSIRAYRAEYDDNWTTQFWTMELYDWNAKPLSDGFPIAVRTYILSPEGEPQYFIQRPKMSGINPRCARDFAATISSFPRHTSRGIFCASTAVPTTAAVLLPADSGAQWLLRSVVFVSQFEWQHWSGCLAARALLCHGISV